MTPARNTFSDDLLKLLGKAKTYDLEHPRFEGMPVFGPIKPGFFYSLYRQHTNTYEPEKTGPRSSASGMMVMMDQTGTHIDTLCHQARDLKLYSGIKVDPAVQTPWGFTKLGAETVPPIVRKGVLLDVPRVKSEEILPEGYLVTDEDLKRCLREFNLTVRKGSVLIVRTGFGRHWTKPDIYSKAAGVSKSGTLWAQKQGIFAAGIDNLAWDQLGDRDPETKGLLFGHLHLIADNGIYIIENLYLEELAKDQCYEFLFVGLPLKIRGATGSPMRPIAISGKG